MEKGKACMGWGWVVPPETDNFTNHMICVCRSPMKKEYLFIYFYIIYIYIYIYEEKSKPDMITLTNPPLSKPDQTNLISVCKDLIFKYWRTDAPITIFLFF